MSDIQFNHQQVIQILSEQVAALTRDNAMLVSALQIALNPQGEELPKDFPNETWEA